MGLWIHLHLKSSSTAKKVGKKYSKIHTMAHFKISKCWISEDICCNHAISTLTTCRFRQASGNIRWREIYMLHSHCSTCLCCICCNSPQVEASSDPLLDSSRSDAWSEADRLIPNTREGNHNSNLGGKTTLTFRESYPIWSSHSYVGPPDACNNFLLCSSARRTWTVKTKAQQYSYKTT